MLVEAYLNIGSPTKSFFLISVGCSGLSTTILENVAFLGARVGKHHYLLLLQATHVDMIPLLEKSSQLRLFHVATDHNVAPLPYGVVFSGELVGTGYDVSNFGTSCRKEDDGNRDKSRD